MAMKARQEVYGERPQAGNGMDQATICAKYCKARCCNYVTIQISTPNSRRDWDEIRWWLMHEGISVVKDEDGWMVIVESRCRNLMPDNRCRIYPYRPNTCRNYDAANCEYTGPVDFEVCLATVEDLARYLNRRRLRRGAPVVRAIGRARRAGERQPISSRPCRRGLLPLIIQARRR